MDRKCSHCGHMWDQLEENVCTQCGIVLEDDNLVNDLFSKSSFVQNVNPRKKRQPRAKNLALKKLENLFSLYDVSEEIKKKTKNLFDKIFEKHRFKDYKSNIELAGYCFYVILRENHTPVLIETFCSQLGCTLSRFNLIKKILKTIIDVDISHQSIESLIPVVLKTMPEDEQNILINKTKKLVKLCDSCWLVTGRSPQSIIIAAAFLCWKSLDPRRMKVAFTKFCSEFNFNNCQAKFRVSEIISLLLKLAEYSSLAEYGFANKANISTKLDYILERAEILRSEMLENKPNLEEKSKAEFNSFRKSQNISSSSTIKTMSQNNLLSQSFSNQTLDNANEMAISDSEIDEYLRTEEEIKQIKDLRDSLHKNIE